MIETEQNTKTQEAGPLFGSANVVVGVEPTTNGESRRDFLKRLGLFGFAAVTLELGLTGCDGPQAENLAEISGSTESERTVADVVNQIRQLENKYPVSFQIPEMMAVSHQEWGNDLNQVARLSFELSFWDSEGRLPTDIEVVERMERTKISSNFVDLNEERKKIDPTAIDINSIDGAFTAGLSFTCNGVDWVLINGIDSDVQNLLIENEVPLMAYFRSVMMHEYEHTKSKAIELKPDEEISLPSGSGARTVKVADGAQLMEKMPYSSEENFGVLLEFDEFLVDEAIVQIGVKNGLGTAPRPEYWIEKQQLSVLLEEMKKRNPDTNTDYEVVMKRWVELARNSKIIDILDDLAGMVSEKTAELTDNERRGWSVFLIDDTLRGSMFMNEALDNPKGMWNKLNK